MFQNVLWPLNAQGGDFSHRGIHTVSLPLHRLLSISIMLLRHYYFMRQKNVTQKFHLYSCPCFIVFKSVRGEGAEKIACAQKNIQQIAPIALWLKEYGKGKLLS